MLQPTRKRLTADQFHRMAETGILNEDDRIELIEGEIIEMNPVGSRHVLAMIRLTHLLVEHLGKVAFISAQLPIRLDDYSEPEPDFALLRRRPETYVSTIPTAADAFLVVEVSDSTLDYDLKLKAPLYARSGISEYWIVDLVHDRLLVHTDPVDGSYRSVRPLRRGESVTPLAFPDHAFAVEDLLV